MYLLVCYEFEPNTLTYKPRRALLDWVYESPLVLVLSNVDLNQYRVSLSSVTWFQRPDDGSHQGRVTEGTFCHERT